jgi:hypothetical protein
VTLIDASLTHVWKPLLHEVAVGTLDSYKDDVIFLGHAKGHGFTFQQGRMDGLDRERKEVWLAPLRDADGREVIPRWYQRGAGSTRASRGTIRSRPATRPWPRSLNSVWSTDALVPA